MPQDLPGDESENGPEPGLEVVDQAEGPTAPNSDPARNAASDVERLLSQATGLQSIVDLAERVAGAGRPRDEEDGRVLYPRRRAR
jgi:hypothetical protein